MSYQIWDDGEMLPPVPPDSEFHAERRADGWWQVTATINGELRDCGRVNPQVQTADEAVGVAKKDVCR